MASTLPTELALTGIIYVGVAALVFVATLSLISVLGVFFILAVAFMQSRDDKTAFVRTQIAKYLISLLLCNLIQAVGGLLNIAWLAEKSIYLGLTCTTQAALKQIGNIGPAIFTFVIAVQTFCLLFLSRAWTNRTCHIIHIAAWAFLLFVLCIENFVIANPEKGPHYGISPSGFWCWISPHYLTERYTSDYLYMLAATVFCIIFYTLVFFRLRGNISVEGYNISIRRRPASRMGRTSSGALVATGDRRVESYLDTVAKHMLWYPIVYIVIVVPMLGTRYASFSGLRSYPELTLAFAALLNLHGFFNAVLFCTTRNILPESWRQRFAPGITPGSRQGYPSNRTNGTWSSTTRVGTVSTGTALQSVDRV